MEDISRIVNIHLDCDSKRSLANAWRSKRAIGRISQEQKAQLMEALDNRQVFRCFLCKHAIESYLFSDCDSLLHVESRIACVTCFANFDMKAYRRLFVDKESLQLEKFSLPFYVPMVPRKERKHYDDFVESFRMSYRQIEQVRSLAVERAV